MENGLPGRTRWLDVAPGRLPGWLESFADRHGGLTGPPQYLSPDTPESDPGDPANSRPGSAKRGEVWGEQWPRCACPTPRTPPPPNAPPRPRPCPPPRPVPQSAVKWPAIA